MSTEAEVARIEGRYFESAAELLARMSQTAVEAGRVTPLRSKMGSNNGGQSARGRQIAMTRARRGGWQQVAQEREWLILGMSFGEVPFEAQVAALKDLEKQFLREARTPAERTHLKRLTALGVLNEAFSKGRSWQDVGPWLRQLKRLGFPDPWSQHHIACIYVQSLPNFPEQAQKRLRHAGGHRAANVDRGRLSVRVFEVWRQVAGLGVREGSRRGERDSGAPGVAHGECAPSP
ncbi:hypothetical protein [Stigmatella erecta]|uniref:hypothetical protein n=1 Tax=Stigmatella erecta TaxID=83460 RepID=UPI0015A53120|nr:hypothetical protein [Stigmatella erecta]